MAKRRSSPMPTQPTMCGSCVFREDGNQVKLSPGRLDEIRAYTIQGMPHQCHHPQLHGKPGEVGCRGARDYLLTMWYRMGLIPQPSDEALETERLRQITLAPEGAIRKSK